MSPGSPFAWIVAIYSICISCMKTLVQALSDWMKSNRSSSTAFRIWPRTTRSRRFKRWSRSPPARSLKSWACFLRTSYPAINKVKVCVLVNKAFVVNNRVIQRRRRLAVSSFRNILTSRRMRITSGSCWTGLDTHWRSLPDKESTEDLPQRAFTPRDHHVEREKSSLEVWTGTLLNRNSSRCSRRWRAPPFSRFGSWWVTMERKPFNWHYTIEYLRLAYL